MIEREDLVQTKDGKMPCFIVYPERGGPRPAVLMLMDGMGIREALRDNARRLATMGYCVMLPSLYYRAGVNAALAIDDKEGWARMSELNNSLTPDRIGADALSCLAHAEDNALARKGPAGVMGYCMGGRLSVTVANQLGAKIAAAAALHPGFLVTRVETSPHRHLDGIRAELYFGIAETDPYLKPEHKASMQETLKTKPIKYEWEELKGTHHGFGVPGGEHYHKLGAETAWERINALFARALS